MLSILYGIALSSWSQPFWDCPVKQYEVSAHEYNPWPPTAPVVVVAEDILIIIYIMLKVWYIETQPEIEQKSAWPKGSGYGVHVLIKTVIGTDLNVEIQEGYNNA